MIDSIIFDVDGTLWDSTDIVALAWTDCLNNQYHIDQTITSAILKSVFGLPLADIAAKLFPELPEDQQMEVINACCDEEHRYLLKQCPELYEDLEKMLQILSEKYPLYIISNCQSGYIEVFLKTTGLSKYFKGHTCNGDTGLSKGANIKKLSEECNLAAPVYVGDTLGDYNACLEANVPFVLANYGFGKVDTPDYTIDCPMDLTRLF